jgi:hypothetical protein
MSKDDDERRFDVRTIERKLNEGELSQDEYDEYLEELPDVSENAVEMEAEFEEGVLEEDEETEAEEADEDEEEDEE